MEAGALKEPPAPLERIVLLLIPPAAREVVAGDMREIYSSPRQYGMTALKTLPFLIASQARRNANLPLLGLQGVFLFSCLVSLAPAKSWTNATFATGLILVLLLARDAYQPDKRPAAKFAIFEALAVSLIVTFFAISNLPLGSAYRVQGLTLFELFMLFLLPFFMPMLGMLRAVLILYSEGRHLLQDEQMAPERMALDYRDFEQRTRRVNRLEITALVLAMGVSSGLILCFGYAVAPIGWALLCLFAIVAAWLLVRGPAPVTPRRADIPALRALYRYELGRQNQIRRFMLWVWFSPALAGFLVMAGRGIAIGRPLLTVVSVLPIVWIGFSIASLNRERGGWISEKIGTLARVRERRTPLDGITAP